MSHRRGSQLARWAATKLTGVRTVARRAGEVRRRVEGAGCSESGVRRMDATLAATGAGGVPGFIGLECRLGASLAGQWLTGLGRAAEPLDGGERADRRRGAGRVVDGEVGRRWS